ncbi:hypothetical protein JW868_04025 [Candidatus Woesearchaeota archaeon]|nr:hypothetical protein [Candidatus Woesearchaeota archaeon]
MAKKKIVSKLKKKKKRWFPVMAPKLFDESQIGESNVSDAELLMDKRFTINLMNLTGDMKKQTMRVSFEVSTVTEGRGMTKITGFEVVPTAVKRLIRRDRDKIDDSVAIKTKDAKYIRLKPLIITNKKIDKDIQTSLRLQTRKTLLDYCSAKNYEQIMSDVITTKLQKHIKEVLLKICPVRNFSIRKATLLVKPPKQILKEGMVINKRKLTAEKKEKKSSSKNAAEPEPDKAKPVKKETAKDTEEESSPSSEKKETRQKENKADTTEKDDKKVETSEKKKAVKKTPKNKDD